MNSDPYHFYYYLLKMDNTNPRSIVSLKRPKLWRRRSTLHVEQRPQGVCKSTLLNQYKHSCQKWKHYISPQLFKSSLSFSVYKKLKNAIESDALYPLCGSQNMVWQLLEVSKTFSRDTWGQNDFHHNAMVLLSFFTLVLSWVLVEFTHECDSTRLNAEAGKNPAVFH